MPDCGRLAFLFSLLTNKQRFPFIILGGFVFVEGPLQFGILVFEYAFHDSDVERDEFPASPHTGHCIKSHDFRNERARELVSKPTAGAMLIPNAEDEGSRAVFKQSRRVGVTRRCESFPNGGLGEWCFVLSYHETVADQRVRNPMWSIQ